MPELPEVETVRRGLEPVLAGAVIARVEQRRPDLRFPFPERFVERLQGRRILHLGRRAKYLQARLDSGDVLVMHLGMSGRFTIAAPAAASPSPRSLRGEGIVGAFTCDTGADPKHDHVVLHTAAGARVTYNDPRRFGFMLLCARSRLRGTSPFFRTGSRATWQCAQRRLSRERSPWPQDRPQSLPARPAHHRRPRQHLCLRGVAPRRPLPHRTASILALKSGRPSRYADPLIAAIREVLVSAITAGGSTLKDYRAADGALGYFQHQFLVYGREGKPCVTPGCRGSVRRSIQAGRSTFHCPVCQR